MFNSPFFVEERTPGAAWIYLIGLAIGLLAIVPSTRSYVVLGSLVAVLLLGPIVMYGGLGLFLAGRWTVRDVFALVVGLLCGVVPLVGYPLAQLEGMTALGWALFLGGFGANLVAVLCAIKAFSRRRPETERYLAPTQP